MKPIDATAVVAAPNMLPSLSSPSRTIHFGDAAHFHLASGISKLSGQGVAEIADTSMQAGHHSVVWNAPVPSGTHFCCMKAVHEETPRERFQRTVELMLPTWVYELS